jgi:hypothetical protein
MGREGGREERREMKGGGEEAEGTPGAVQLRQP